MPELSDSEIADAAREAGITPAELRRMLAERESPSRPSSSSIALRQPALVEMRLASNPEQSVHHVRTLLEHETGCASRMQGKHAADLLDSERGVIYRLRSESDGAQGALVRVELDQLPAKSKRTLVNLSLGSSVALLTLTALLLAGSTIAAFIAAFGLVSAFSVRTLHDRQHRAALEDAQTLVTRVALLSEETPIGALPGAGT